MTNWPWWRSEPWRSWLICHDWETCEHDHHTQVARTKWRRAIALPWLDFVGAYHARTCDMTAQQAHGTYYTQMAIRNCGIGGERHIAHLAAQPWLRHLWELHTTHTTDLTLDLEESR